MEGGGVYPELLFDIAGAVIGGDRQRCRLSQRVGRGAVWRRALSTDGGGSMGSGLVAAGVWTQTRLFAGTKPFRPVRIIAGLRDVE